MKRTLLFGLIGLFSFIGFSQIELQPNPSTINSGTFTFKYGELGDYSIFDPLSNPNLYLYTGLQTDADPLTWDYNDGDFTLENIGQMIPLNFDNELGYYVATFNPKTRPYIEEVTQLLTTVPDGTEVFDWYFLITTNDLSRQSPDLKGSDYGFNAAVLSVNELALGNDILVFNTALKIQKQGQYQIAIYDVLGKLVNSETVIIGSPSTLKLPLTKSGLYIVKVTSGQHIKTFKVIKQ